MQLNKSAVMLAVFVIAGQEDITVASEPSKSDYCEQLLPDLVEQVLTSAFSPLWKVEYQNCLAEANSIVLYQESDREYRRQMKSDAAFRSRGLTGSNNTGEKYNRIGEATKRDQYRSISPEAQNEAPIDTVKGFVTIQPSD